MLLHVARACRQQGLRGLNRYQRCDEIHSRASRSSNIGVQRSYSLWSQLKSVFSATEPVSVVKAGDVAARERARLAKHKLKNDVGSQAIKQAEDAIQAKQYQEAKQLLTAALQFASRTKAMELFVQRSLCNLELGFYHYAIDDASKAVFLAPKEPRAYVALGDAYMKINKFDTAYKFYAKANELGGNCTGLMHHAILEKQQLPERLAQFGTKLGLAPGQTKKQLEEARTRAEANNDVLPTTVKPNSTLPQEELLKQLSQTEPPPVPGMVVAKYDEQVPTAAEDHGYFQNLMDKFSLQVVDGAKKGRGIVATAFVPSGVEIFRERPIVAATSRSDRCQHCMMPIEDMNHAVGCRGCDEEKYCSTGCRDSAAEEYHSKICGAPISKLRSEIYSDPQGASKLRNLLLVKLVGWTKSQKQYPASTLDMPHFRQMHTSLLHPHRKEIQYDIKKTMTPYRQVLVASNSKVDPLFDLEWFDKLTGKLSHNIFPVTYPNDPDAYRNGTATALYEISSYLNHSCEPNIKLSINAAKSGTLLIATTLRAISENEELTVAYVNPNSPVKERQRLLALQHGFQCRCPKCIRELSSEPKQVSKTTNPRIVPPSGPPRIVSRK